MIEPPEEQVIAGRVAHDAIQLGKLLCKKEISTREVNREIETMIKDNGCWPALLGYNPPFSTEEYPASICICLNEEAVHGEPCYETMVTENDIITIDLVVEHKGWHADTARTFTNSQDKARVEFVHKALIVHAGALASIKPNLPIGIYGSIVEEASAVCNLHPIKEYCGHGIGETIHDEPQVLTYNSGQTDLWQSGKSYAVEPVLALDPQYQLLNIGDWTVVANCLTAHNEDTVFVTDTGIVNLTGVHK